jgi:hypothetical protein
MLGVANRPDLSEPCLLQQDITLNAETKSLTAKMTCVCLSHSLGDFMKHHP